MKNWKICTSSPPLGEPDRETQPAQHVWKTGICTETAVKWAVLTLDLNKGENKILVLLPITFEGNIRREGKCTNIFCFLTTRFANSLLRVWANSQIFWSKIKFIHVMVMTIGKWSKNLVETSCYWNEFSRRICYRNKYCLLLANGKTQWTAILRCCSSLCSNRTPTWSRFHSCAQILVF